METLMGSCWKIFPLRFGEKDRLIWRPGDGSQSRKENCFLRSQKRDLLPGLSFHCKPASSVSSSAPDNQTLVEGEETDQILVAEQQKTARVRFNLTKECAFGQHFMIVGDDPCLGSWDPSDGVRFAWSDGHVWTAELDVPCGKVIEYKFILKVDDKTILWQPGPDRVLETWETEKIIAVFEDWDHPGFQEIVEEEEFMAELNDEESFISSEVRTVSENLSKTTQDEGGTDAEKQLSGTNELSSLHDKVKQESTTYINCSKHEETSVSEQEAPVLLPDLIPMLTDEESLNEVKDKENIDLSKTTQDEGTDAEKQLSGTNELSSLHDEVKQDSTTYIKCSKHEESSVSEQEAAVLLPGLIPMLTDVTDEESQNEEKDKENIDFSKTIQDKGTDAEKQLSGTNELSSLHDEVKQDSTTYINCSKHEESSVSEQEASVLLPGLISMLTDVTDEESLNGVKDKENIDLSKTTQDEGTDAEKQLSGENELSCLHDKVKQDSTTYINCLKHEESTFSEQEAPALFPGLIPMLTDEKDEESLNEVKDKELKASHYSASLRSTETSKVVKENDKGSHGKVQLEILKGNLQWGRGMVQKFFEILGF